MIENLGCIVNINSMLNRVDNIAPEASFYAKYDANDSNLTSFLKAYRKKSFIYFLASNVEDKKCIIYIGQSKDQYQRILPHKARFEYDELYLFYVPVKRMKEVEAELIEEFSPLYNRSYNKEHCKEMDNLGLGKDAYKSRQVILDDIYFLVKNKRKDAATYFLPTKLIVAISKEAKKQNVSIDQYLENILETTLPPESIYESIQDSIDEESVEPSVVTAKEYADMHNKSVEQIKVYCRDGRIVGAKKTGRDWVIPKTAPYPVDKRLKCY